MRSLLGRCSGHARDPVSMVGGESLIGQIYWTLCIVCLACGWSQHGASSPPTRRYVPCQSGATLRSRFVGGEGRHSRLHCALARRSIQKVVITVWLVAAQLALRRGATVPSIQGPGHQPPQGFRHQRRHFLHLNARNPQAPTYHIFLAGLLATGRRPPQWFSSASF